MSRQTILRISPFFLMGLLLVSTSLSATNLITWIAQNPNNNMDNPANWNPNFVPQNTDTAVFNSTISNINFSPTNQTSDFSVCALQFSNQASPFTINIDNHLLTLNGHGITGAQTNATINVANINNPSFIGTQLSFQRPGGSSSGSAHMNVTNIATVSGNISSNALNIIQNQFTANSPFLMQNGGNLVVSNAGTDSSVGIGNNVTSALSSSQMQMNNTFTGPDNITLSLDNTGTYSGNNSAAGNRIAFISGLQFYNADQFLVGNNFNFTVENSGTNSSTGTGNNYIGAVLGAQSHFNSIVALGNDATFLISNHGSNSANAAFTDFTGYLIDQQLYVNDQFTAGENFSMTITNIGQDDSVGAGGGLTAIIDSLSGFTGSQALFNDSFIVGNNAIISTQNAGTSSGVKAAHGALAAIMNQDQMFFAGLFNAGNDLKLSVSNMGTDSSGGVGANSIGNISRLQLGFNGSTTVGNNATFLISNSGNFSGSNASTFNYSGSVGGDQFQANNNFQAGNLFYLGIENTGTHSNNGIGFDFTGAIIGNQAHFQGTTILGDDATILISNSGTNSSTSFINHVGYIGNSQFQSAGNFSTGKNLNFSITNTGSNTGDISNNVGYVVGSQAIFLQDLTIDDGSIINVTNNGNVNGVQILMNQGFNVLSGKAIIQAVNRGTLGGPSILIQGNNSGGNANIILENASMVIATNLANFTIGELNGNSTSTVQSMLPLIIDTHSSTQGNFQGAIQDFPAISSSLIKQGAGTQTLSGTNTYTGSTTIQNGLLTLSGSVAGDVNVNAGTFSLAGTTPSIGGALVVSGGTLSLANAITSNVGSFFNLGAGTTLQVDMGSNTTSPATITTSGAATVNPNSSIHVINPPAQSGFVPLIISGGGAGGLQPIPVTGNTLLASFSSKVSGSILGLVVSFTPATTFATESNKPVAEALGSVPNAMGSLAQLYGQLPLFTDADILNEGLESIIQPAISGSALDQSFVTAMIVNDLLNDRINKIKQSKKLALNNATEPKGYASGDLVPDLNYGWFKVFAQHANQNERNDIEGYKESTWGFALGKEAQFTPQTLIGISLNWAKADAHNKDSGSTTKINNYQLSLYSEYDFEGPWYLNGIASVAYNDYNTTHHILFGTVRLHPTGDFHGSQFGLQSELGYDVDVNDFTLTPLVSLFYSHLHLSSYTETGANTANQRVEGDNFNMLLGGLGARLSYDFLCPRIIYQSEVHARVFYDFINDNMQVTSQFTGGGPSFTSIGFTPAATSFNIGASITTFSNLSDIILTASYDFEYKDDYAANAGFLSVRYLW